MPQLEFDSDQIAGSTSRS